MWLVRVSEAAQKFQTRSTVFMVTVRISDYLKEEL